MDKIHSLAFFRAWVEAANNKKDHLISIWRQAKTFTSYIKGHEESLLKDVANKLELLCYDRDYYSIDTVLYKQEDLVPNLPDNWYWLRDLRIAFEHENAFNSGLYKEVAHLLLVNADLRVLVTYPNGDENEHRELAYLHKIIQGNRSQRQISDDENFLLIFGYESGFEWEGYVYKHEGWKQL